MGSQETIIRCSGLPSYMDCNRRAAAKMFTEEIEASGYQLRKLASSVGAALGTAGHYGIEVVLTNKIHLGVLGSVEDACAAAIERFSEEIAPGVVWDDTTPSMNAAIVQLKRQVQAYMPMAAVLDPKAVELALKADVGDGFVLAGHIDIIERNGAIRDEKYGAREGQYWLQLGGYGLLATSAGHEVGSLNVDWIPRVGKTKHQPPVTTTQYDVQQSQIDAYQVIQRIKADVQQFRRDPDRLYQSFPANPMSMMCTDKYCPAHGTEFCNAWKYRAEKTQTNTEFPV